MNEISSDEQEMGAVCKDRTTKIRHTSQCLNSVRKWKTKFLIQKRIPEMAPEILLFVEKYTAKDLPTFVLR